MPKLKDITGNRYGCLVAARPDHINKWGRWSWEFHCDCGLLKIIDANQVTSGNTKSCGCHRVRAAKHKRLSHGQSESDTYQCWLNMRRRCSNERDKSWSAYGGRGIKVCDSWQQSFETFFSDMGPKPPGKTLDRIDNESGYRKENCRWSSRAEQSKNTQRAIVVTHEGISLALNGWARAIGISNATIMRRYRRGELPPRLLRPREEKYINHVSRKLPR